MRKYFVAGNWKMNGSMQQNAKLLQDLIPLVSDLGKKVECVVCPPSIYLGQVNSEIKLSNIMLGAQNVASKVSGAFTGEISVQMLGEFGCKYVIIGHSERRQLFCETDQGVAEKFALVQSAGMTPILCVGETREQMEAGKGFAVVANQLQVVLDHVGVQAFAQAVIAYEPVWAIGTGLTATPAQAQSMHQKIRAKLSELDVDVASRVQIVYGGSVNGTNAADLFAEQDIDGGLIGGAALKAQEFSDICHAALRMAE